ncbi:MAG TPA: family 1 encapsulin nanocompartment shell protein [Candidatus Limnocylindrales bacterium]|nr:family 1 encapsulin nanocompartment shell protein [Candidatus Limnocylindrales bacterium]
MKYLNREAAPISSKVWEEIDELVVSTAKSLLVGRKLLDVEGPLGLGFKALVSKTERIAEAGPPLAAKILCSPTLPIPQIYSSFSLSISMIEAYETYHQPLDLDAAFQAAKNCILKEDELVFFGYESLSITGILNTPGVHKIPLGDWSRVGQAIEDVIQAANQLDKAGYPGPYALALASPLYNSLFRLYKDSDVLQIENLRSLVTEGIFKTPVLQNKGVLLDTVNGNQIILGQDLMTSFSGFGEVFYEFTISESLVPNIGTPEAICIISA